MSIMSGMTYFHKIFNHNYIFARFPRKCKECEKDNRIVFNIECLASQRSSGVCVFTLKNLYKPQSGCQREHDNRNSFILHSSMLPKLIVGHCVSAVKSEVCTFECSHGAYIILTLLWFSNSSTQSVSLKFLSFVKSEVEQWGFSYFIAPIVDLLKSECLAFQVIDSVWPHYFISEARRRILRIHKYTSMHQCERHVKSFDFPLTITRACVSLCVL